MASEANFRQEEYRRRALQGEVVKTRCQNSIEGPEMNEGGFSDGIVDTPTADRYGRDSVRRLRVNLAIRRC